LTQGAELQLQPDPEQEQEHAEIGDGLKCIARLVAQGMQNEACHEVADQRGEPHRPGGEPDHERGDEERYLHGRDYDPSRGRALDRRRGTPAWGENFS
jgi:hypothetical protein